MVLSSVSRLKNSVVLLLFVLLFLNGCSQQASNQTNVQSSPNYFYAGALQHFTAVGVDGAAGNFSQPKPSLNPKDNHTLAELAVESADGKQIVEVGWSVDPALYDDDNPHLFVFRWVDSDAPTSCYNSTIPPCSFKITTEHYDHKPGAPVAVDRNPKSTSQFAIRFMNGNWEIFYEGDEIGDYPGTIWKDPVTQQDRFTQLGYADWFGEVETHEAVPCSQMGNGIAGTDPGSAEINNMFVFINGQQMTANAKPHITNSKYYSVGNFAGDSFTYGGPGATTTRCPQNCPSPSLHAFRSLAPCTAPSPQPTQQAGTLTVFTLSSSSGEPLGITAGPDGNLWFTENTEGGVDKIGRMSPSGMITEFPIPTGLSSPQGITAGPDGNLWFTEQYTDKIGRMTPSGVFTEFPVPQYSGPQWITTGPDGNLWFTYGSGIGRITPAGSVTEYSFNRPANLGDITAGPDGNLWFADTLQNMIGRITTSGTITEFPVPTAHGYPKGIVKGLDGNLWFTETAGKIGRITPSGVITEFLISQASNDSGIIDAVGITLGPDGNLWFAEGHGSDIGRMTPTGDVSEFALSNGPNDLQVTSGINRITLGPDGNLWLTQWNSVGRIMRFTP